MCLAQVARMNRFILLSALVLGTGAPAAAQDHTNASVAQPQSERVQARAERARARAERAREVGVKASAALGWVVGAGLSAGAFAVTLYLRSYGDYCAGDYCREQAATGPYYLLAGLLSLLPSSTAVLLGYAAGGRGEWGYTFLGSFIGTLPGTLVTVLATDPLHSDFSTGEQIGLALMAVGSCAGSLVGYFVSDSVTAATEAHSTLAPTLSVSSDSASVGMSGAF